MFARRVCLGEVMGPIAITVVAAQVQTALCLLCVAIAFATPTGRRNVFPTVMLFGGAALGGFLGFMAWYGRPSSPTG